MDDWSWKKIVVKSTIKKTYPPSAYPRVWNRFIVITRRKQSECRVNIVLGSDQLTMRPLECTNTPMSKPPAAALSVVFYRKLTFLEWFYLNLLNPFLDSICATSDRRHHSWYALSKCLFLNIGHLSFFVSFTLSQVIHHQGKEISEDYAAPFSNWLTELTLKIRLTPKLLNNIMCI